MPMNPIAFLSWPDEGFGGCWDHGIIDDLIEGRFGTPPGWRKIIAAHHNIEREAPLYGHGIAIVHVSGRFHHDRVDELNEYLSVLAGVLLVVTSDEEHLFPIEDVKHPNVLIWRQLPRTDHPSTVLLDRWFGEGVPFGTRMQPPVGNSLAWSFAGQITHPRRHQWMGRMADRLINRPDERAVLLASNAFTDGVDRAEYLRLLARSRAAPAPAGPETQSSFRCFEALEAGAIPIVDETRPDGEGAGYWQLIFKSPPPFPILLQPEEFDEALDEIINPAGEWGRIVCHAWWQREKRELAVDLVHALDLLIFDDTGSLSPAVDRSQRLSFVITASPIETQWETLATTIGSLPSDCEIIVAFDGCREEQEERRGAYTAAVAGIVDRMQHAYTNVVPYVADRHLHQAVLAQRALELVETGCVGFIEHDTPVCGLIPWDSVCDAVEGSDVDVVRFHHEKQIPPEHDYLMGRERSIEGMQLQITNQWSQRPHVATTEWYRRTLATHFGPDDRTMIEDAIYGWAEAGNVAIGIMVDEDDAGSIRRSTHLDGRGDDPKYSMTHNGEQIA